MSAETLDTLQFPLWGSRLIEASAGTGKTYTIASLYVRLVLGHGDTPGGRPLLPPEILVVTFTRAATQELRDRIRKRLSDAAACFLQWAEGDAFLRNLRDQYPPERWPACARQLQVAADWMDEAAVSTIDAWCYRMLREHAFDSASLFEIEMDTEAQERIAEATRDYWRQHVAPLSRDDFEMVLAAIARRRKDTRVPADCDALAGMLARVWLRHASLLGPQPDPAEAIANRRRRLEECKAPWRIWASELRELLAKASADGCVDRRKLNDSRREEWLGLLDVWAHDPALLMPFKPNATAWHRFTPEGIAEIWKKGEPPQHPAFAAFAGLRRQIGLCDKEVERVVAHAAVWVARRVAELRRGKALLDYSDLLEKLDAALAGPNGDKLARTIRAQFPAALIDEFQDTSPIQYRLFDRIYEVHRNGSEALLALIGDPKQAIYRFRGADIHSYLQARQACSGRLYTLGNNFRSSADMVAAVNHLFASAESEREGGAFLFRRPDRHGNVVNPVPFHPVAAAANPGEWRVEDSVPRQLTVWYATQEETVRGGGAAVAAACASEVLRLLQLGSEGRAGFMRNGEFVPLRAADMAILVNDGYEAHDLRKELSRRGIRSVYLSDDSSVYQTAAASEILAWLRACAEPEEGDYVRSALATATLGLSWTRLEALVADEGEWQAMLERFAAYREHWRRFGVLPLLRRYMHDFGVPSRLFAAAGEGLEGERHLTDLLHLAELLQEASGSLDGEHAVIRYLEEQIDAGGASSTESDASRIRLESDAGLVQVVTVHKSKGLEYPLVFYPYAYRARPVKDVSVPAPYRDSDNALRVLAHEGDADRTLLEDIHHQLEAERLAEDLRKLYVALTRARYATWITVLPGDACRASALEYLLGGPEACDSGTIGDTLSRLREACDAIAVEVLPEPTDGRYRPVASSDTGFHWRTMSRRIETSWTMSSYSSIARLVALHAGDAGVLHPDDGALALPDEPSLESYLEAYAAEPRCEVPVGQSGPVTQIHDFPRGAAPGSLLHGLLEWVFRQGPTTALADPDALLAVVERRCRSRGWEAHAPAVADWLRQFFNRPFRLSRDDAAESPALVLAGLARAVPELEFWFGVSNAALPRLDALVSRHILPGQPRNVIPAGKLNGMLKGFIDLVFEHDGRYYVADYKSNWLGPDDGAYEAPALARAVLEHRYDLQAAIYLYALHRHLISRLGDAYDYDTHFGGALIFFMRGCMAPSQGVVRLRPGREMLKELESVFGAAPGDES